jgi:hypothetical protein
MIEDLKELIDNVKSTQLRLCKILEAKAGDQGWQPETGQWSFRSIAAHLATVDKECYLDRVVRISTGENPFFESYFNTERDFSRFDLRESLREWKATRQEIINFVSSLPEDKLALTGKHAAVGTITVIDVLKMMHDHDQEHIQHLEALTDAHAMKTS